MYKLPELEYDYNDLGQYISGDIMKLHHAKHHQTYVDKLNSAIEQIGADYLHDKSVTDLIRDIDSLPEDVRTDIRNNGGGHYNHSLFWQWMSPRGGGSPTGAVAELIDAKYGSFQSFVDEFTAEALGVFGSGWCWMMPDGTIATTANQDSPVMEGNDEPLLGLDVWEHAYYLDYKNQRDDYVAAWWNVVNWSYVEQRYNSQV